MDRLFCHYVLFQSVSSGGLIIQSLGSVSTNGFPPVVANTLPAQQGLLVPICPYTFLRKGFKHINEDPPVPPPSSSMAFDTRFCALLFSRSNCSLLGHGDLPPLHSCAASPPIASPAEGRPSEQCFSDSPEDTSPHKPVNIFVG